MKNSTVKIKKWRACKGTIKISLLLLCFILFSFPIKAQDIQQTQYYNAIQFLNPAFVGSSHAFRGVTNLRTQWPGLHAKYTTLYMSADYNLSKYNSGVGGYVVLDRQGPSVIRSFETAFQYASWVNLNQTYSLRFGLQASYHGKGLDYNQLTLPSTYNNNTQSYTSVNPLLYDFHFKNTRYFDFASGVVLYSRNLWVGYALYHLNRPETSFLTPWEMEKLAPRHDIIAGYKFESNIGKRENLYTNNFAITPTFLYKMQSKSDQLDLGTYLSFKNLMLGAWYRGIPVKSYNNNMNNESIIFLVGVKWNYFTVNYSYDFVISRLYGNSGGAHEINITFLYPLEEEFSIKNKRFKSLPCPRIQKDRRKFEVAY